MPNPQPAKQAAARAYNLFNMVAFTIGTKQTNTINVAMQLKDARGQNLQQIAKGNFYLSDNADGSTLTATATTSALAVGTNGVLLNIPTTGKIGSFITDSQGRFDVNLVQTQGGTNYYLVCQFPDGSIAVSSVIAF